MSKQLVGWVQNGTIKFVPRPYTTTLNNAGYTALDKSGMHNQAQVLKAYNSNKTPHDTLFKCPDGSDIYTAGAALDQNSESAIRKEWNRVNQTAGSAQKTPIRQTAPTPKQTTKSTLANLLEQHKNVILEGPAGTGKTHSISALKNHYTHTRIVVCHPAFGYEDLVIGLRPSVATGGFDVKPGHLLEMVELAEKDPDNPYLLVLDEINRCNTAAVFGDLLMVIDPTKRGEQKFAATLPLHWNKEIGATTDLVLPENLHILGTMNTTDRSIAPLDLALRRRFVFDRIDPVSSKTLKELLKIKKGDELETPIGEWERINAVLRKHVSPDAVLGHAYFFHSTVVAELWKHFLLPQIGEILVTFNRTDLIETGDLRKEVREKGGWCLNVEGAGIGKYPVVRAHKTDCGCQ